MEENEARDRFDRADDLFRRGRYAEAIDVLNELETNFPKNHRVLNAKAKTLAKMGKLQSALAVCDRLLNELGYEKIRSFRNQLSGAVDLATARGQRADMAGPPPLPKSR